MIVAFPKTYEWIYELAHNEDFLNTVSLSDQAISEQYSMDLVTRFLTFRTMPDDSLGKIRDINDFLSNHLGAIDKLRESSRNREDKIFTETFRFINKELGDSAFRRFDKDRGRFIGGFLISGFESVAMGIGFNVSDNGLLPKITDFKKRVQDIWSDDRFATKSGSGIRASTRNAKIIPLGRKVYSA